ncbi:MAG: hypothetical protein QM433_10490, partial [Euryarchaeota archaeon]|nr:hypothetical protein [Euryarchaeota archaeon]
MKPSTRNRIAYKRHNPTLTTSPPHGSGWTRRRSEYARRQGGEPLHPLRQPPRGLSPFNPFLLSEAGYAGFPATRRDYGDIKRETPNCSARRR